MTEVDQLPLSDFDRKLVSILDQAHGHVRAAAKNAVVHIERAWPLRTIDSEMAVFRGITAEEEAATALIVCLQELRYPNAERLRRRDHVHKLAVYAFFGMVNNHLAGLHPMPETRLSLDPPDVDQLRLRLLVNVPGGWAQPVPPLNFSILEEDRSGPPYNFQREIEKFLEHNGIADFRSHLKQIARERNLLLYASYDGRPALLDDHSDWLLRARDRVFAILRVLCLIFPYAEHQPFVQQCIAAFLAAVDGLDYDSLVQQSGPDL